jgi:hypothetical protein
LGGVVHGLAQDDLTALADVLAEAHADVDGSDGLPRSLLTGLYALVRCDSITYCELDAESETGVVLQDYDGAHRMVVDRHGPDDPYYRRFWSTLMTSYAVRLDHGDRHQLTCSLASRRPRARRLVLHRGREPDFDERDRLLLSLARPHLDELRVRQDAVRSCPSAPLLRPQPTELRALVAGGTALTSSRG